MSDSLWPHGLQLTRPPCPSPTPRVYSNSLPLSWWCHPTISSFGIPFSHLQNRLDLPHWMVLAPLLKISSVQSVQLLSHVWLFAIPWTSACQVSLFITNSWSLLKLICIELVMPSNHLILCCPLFLPPSIFPSIRVFSNESVLHIRYQSIGVLASASVLPMNIQPTITLNSLAIHICYV